MRRIAVRGIAVHDKKLLCVKLKPYQTALKGDYWCLPGGTVDESEPLVEAIKREMIEETAIEPEVGSLLYVHQLKLGDTEHLEFFFHIKNANDYLNIDLSQASHAAEEVELIEFADPKSTRILPEFLTQENIASHIDANRPPKIFSYL